MFESLISDDCLKMVVLLNNYYKVINVWALHRSSARASYSAAPGSVLGITIYTSEIYQAALLGQRTVPIKQSHLVQSRALQIQFGHSTKVVLQKIVDKT